MAPLGPIAGPTPALVFIGFMGAGKSRAARSARDAGLEAFDTDELLELELGCSIEDYFTREGEAEFRRREAALASGLLDRADGGVIALGGGSVLSDSVREALRRHVVVWLEVDAETSWRRVEGKRPLARDRGRFDALFTERVPYYESLADAILPGDSESVRRALPSLLALRDLPAARLAWGRSASGEYPVFFGRDLLGSFWPHDGEPFCVTDSDVGPLLADRLGPEARRVVIAAGERAKTWAGAERVLADLARLGTEPVGEQRSDVGVGDAERLAVVRPEASE